MADAQKESERVASFKGGGAEAAEEEQLLVTINPAMGKIVKVEKMDKTGKRQEIAEDEWAKLVGDDEVDELEAALEGAFESGVAAILGEEYEDDDAEEEDEEKALRRLLIAGLLRRNHLRRRILQRVLVSRLLRRRFSKSRKRQ